jgi:hypothetical protein
MARRKGAESSEEGGKTNNTPLGICLDTRLSARLSARLGYTLSKFTVHFPKKIYDNSRVPRPDKAEDKSTKPLLPLEIYPITLANQLIRSSNTLLTLRL